MIDQRISKIFNMLFTYPIWRIEMDVENKLIAVETRNPNDTLPYFNVITFNGDDVLRDYKAIAKEWILTGFQCRKLILKKISSNSPIDAGLHIIDCDNPDKQKIWYDYVFLNRVEHGVLLRPKIIEQGLQLFLDLKTMSIENITADRVKPFDSHIVCPVLYNGKKPDFLNSFCIDDEIWIAALDNYFIWAFYEKDNDGHYQITIVRSTKDALIDSIVAVSRLSLKFFNIYFLVDKQIFLLTDNKQEFVSYLV